MTYMTQNNWPSPSCDIARDKQLEAPPNFDRSEWKRHFSRDWGAFHPRFADDNAIQANYDIPSNMLVTLWWFPVCASLLVAISLLRSSGVILPRRIRTQLGGFSQLPGRLSVTFVTLTRPIRFYWSGPREASAEHDEAIQPVHSPQNSNRVARLQGQDPQSPIEPQIRIEIPERRDRPVETNLSCADSHEQLLTSYYQPHENQGSPPDCDPARSDYIDIEPARRPQATRSGAVVIQSQDSGLRRRHAAQSKDETDSALTQHTTVPVPCLNLSHERKRTWLVNGVSFLLKLWLRCKYKPSQVARSGSFYISTGIMDLETRVLSRTKGQKVMRNSHLANTEPNRKPNSAWPYRILGSPTKKRKYRA